MSCTPSLWRRSPLADTASLLANGGDILNVGIYSRIIAFRDKCYMNKQVLRILERTSTPQVNIESPHRTQEGALLQVPCELSQRKNMKAVRNRNISTLHLGNEMMEIKNHQVTANRSNCLRQGLDLTNPLSCPKRPKTMSSL